MIGIYSKMYMVISSKIALYNDDQKDFRIFNLSISIIIKMFLMVLLDWC